LGQSIVIALGGNALGGNLPEQMIAVKRPPGPSRR
jgi:carbamate kinase